MNNEKDYKAFEDGGMDEFLRGALSGHRVEPGPGLWKGISRKLLWRELTRFNFTNFSARSWITGAAGALILAAAIYLVLPEQAAVSPPVSAVSVVSLNNSGNYGSGTTTAPAPPRNVNLPAAAEKPGSTSPGRIAAQGVVTTAKNESGNKSLAYAGNLHDNTQINPSLSGNVSEQYPSGMTEGNTGAEADVTLLSLTPVEPLSTPFLAVPKQDTVITFTTPYGISRVHVASPAPAQFLSASFEIEPEMSFYSAPEPYSNLNVWANAGVSWHFSRFSLSSGAGLGYVYDRGNYNVEYKSNDSVGYYSGVVSYTVGTNNEIIYNTTSRNVYDSLLHKDDYRTLNRYAYLQVPLLLGYRLVETPRFGLTFQAGPAISFLLGERLSEPVIDYENARIVRVDDNTPQRVHTTWQVWGTLMLDYRLSRKVSLYLRPSCKYYLNPVAELENAAFRSPWSAGLGIGVQFNFSPKKKTP